MAKKKGGRKRTKTGALELIATVALTVDGGRRILGKTTQIQFWATHPAQLLKDPKAAINDLQDAIVGGAEIAFGTKGIKMVKKVLPGPIKNARIPGTSRKWV